MSWINFSSFFNWNFVIIFIDRFNINNKILFSFFIYRFGISDVCRSVVEANMGGGFCIKAVTRYAVLCDVENILILRSETEQNIRNFIFHKHHPTTCWRKENPLPHNVRSTLPKHPLYSCLVLLDTEIAWWM